MIIIKQLTDTKTMIDPTSMLISTNGTALETTTQYINKRIQKTEKHK